LIDAALQTLRSGQRFDNWSAFQQWISGTTGISLRSLRRHEAYRRRLLEHLAKNPRILIAATDRPDRNLEHVADAILMETLKRDNARLKRAFSERLSAAEPSPNSAQISRQADTSERRLAFEDTATILIRLLEHLSAKELGIVIDAERKTIVDVAEDGEAAIVAGPPSTRAFFEWLSRHERSVASLE
jgi:hypothetical protein